MHPNSLIIPALISYIVIVVVVAIEHHFCRHWPELVRRGMGGITVLAITLIPALLGYICIWTWLFIALAFILAGAMLAAFVVMELSRNHKKALDALLLSLTGDENV